VDGVHRVPGYLTGYSTGYPTFRSSSTAVCGYCCTTSLKMGQRIGNAWDNELGVEAVADRMR